MNTLLRWPVRMFVACTVLALAGCGTNIEEILYQSASSVGQTILDVLLTEAANDIADAIADRVQPPEDGDDNGDDGDDGDNGGGGADGIEAGAAIYADNGCAACHCADAAGGCALSAPSLADIDTPTLSGVLSGDVGHPGGTLDLSDQEVADLAAYFASLGDSGSGGDGATLFANNCSACHGADGTSIRNITGFSAAELSAGLASATHGGISLSEAEVAAIAEFLGG